ncbi:hypothetical protein [Roseomonas genomospecies 6]|uniref:Uncharacterized protein n=1 Tax=Roseomonas genomospecies 6 TaxID=214106 RepID=A0A9W7U068_9PROT|nr:hypothetical protein [Roseomonas genomospecies 6]KAA0682815.1 hypothetical protein DS843_05220 [Roseomonas genomospecies 6]
MAIDATIIDATAASRPVQRERSPAQAVPALGVLESRDSPDRYEAEAEMSFGDFLDIINPLQHIPVVNSIYREITGDTIKPSSKVIGGILFGGPLGGMASIANAVVEQAQGKDIGGQVMASLGFGGGDGGGNGGSAQPPAGSSGATAVAALPDHAAGSSAPAPAAPPTTALPTTALPIAAAHGAGAAASGAGRDGLAASGTPHPSRMPARDTPLANSMMAKHSAAKPHPTTVGFAATAAPSGFRKAADAPAPAPAAHSDAAPAAAPSAAAPAANGNAFAPVTPDMLSETMMRNLAKYEQGRRAAQAPAPSLRVSG